MTFAELEQTMIASDTLEVGTGASDAEIQAAEAALTLSIAGTYRSFLRRFGWGGVGYLELYGLGKDVPQHLNLIDITKSERTEMTPKLRTDLLPVMNDGGGNLYCLDGTSPEPRVVFWDHEDTTDQVPTVEADDFAAWFATKIAAMEGG